jgi:hypothetical protein
MLCPRDVDPVADQPPRDLGDSQVRQEWNRHERRLNSPRDGQDNNRDGR